MHCLVPCFYLLDPLLSAVYLQINTSLHFLIVLNLIFDICINMLSPHICTLVPESDEEDISEDEEQTHNILEREEEEDKDLMREPVFFAGSVGGNISNQDDEFPTQM